MTAIPLMCWRCKNKKGYCAMVEEWTESREFCRQWAREQMRIDCGDALCEGCNIVRLTNVGEADEGCTGYDAMTIDEKK